MLDNGIVHPTVVPSIVYFNHQMYNLLVHYWSGDIISGTRCARPNIPPTYCVGSPCHKPEVSWDVMIQHTVLVLFRSIWQRRMIWFFTVWLWNRIRSNVAKKSLLPSCQSVWGSKWSSWFVYSDNVCTTKLLQVAYNTVCTYTHDIMNVRNEVHIEYTVCSLWLR